MEVADSEVSRAPVAPFSVRALIADPHKADELFEARVSGRVVLVADWFIVGVAVLGVGVEDMFEQLPSLLGRQLEHCLLAVCRIFVFNPYSSYARAQYVINDLHMFCYVVILDVVSK